jgi:hypothetical protein
VLISSSFSLIASQREHGAETKLFTACDYLLIFLPYIISTPILKKERGKKKKSRPSFIAPDVYQAMFRP